MGGGEIITTPGWSWTFPISKIAFFKKFDYFIYSSKNYVTFKSMYNLGITIAFMAFFLAFFIYS